MFELWAVWPPDDPNSVSTSERVRLERVHPEQLEGAAAKRLRDAHLLGAGLEIVRSTRVADIRIDI